MGESSAVRDGKSRMQTLKARETSEGPSSIAVLDGLLSFSDDALSLAIVRQYRLESLTLSDCLQWVSADEAE